MLDSPTAATLSTPPAGPRLSTAAAAFRSPVFAVVVCVFLLLAHVGWSFEIYPVEARVGAALLGVLAFLAARAASPDRLPFVALASMQLYLHFGVPTFYRQRLMTLSGPLNLSDQSLGAAVGAALLSFGLMYVMASPGRAFGQLVRPQVARALPRAPISRHATGIRAWSALSAAAHLVMSLRPQAVPESLTFAVTTMFGPTVPQVLLFLLWRETRRSLDRNYFFGVTGLAVFLGFLSGMLQAAFIPVLVALILMWTSSGRIQLTLTAATIVAFLTLNPAKHAFRKQSWKSDSAGLVDKATMWVDAIGTTWSGDRVDVSDKLKESAERVSSLLYVAHTLEWVPRYVPFAGSDRWWPIVYSYIPRVIWADKPDLTGVFNQKYTVAFGLQSEAGTSTTTIHLPQMSDAYWAFGWLGVAIAGGLTGLLLGVYEGAFAKGSWTSWTVGMLFLSRMQATSHLGANFTGILQVFVIGAAALWGVAAITALNRVRSKG